MGLSEVGDEGPLQTELDEIIAKFEEAWQTGDPPTIEDYLTDVETKRQSALLELVHVDLERRLGRHEEIGVKKYLARFPDLARDHAAVVELISSEYQLRKRYGGSQTLQSFLEQFPQYRDDVAQHLAVPMQGGRSAVRVLCPQCRHSITLPADSQSEEVLCPSCGSAFHLDLDATRSLKEGPLRRMGKFELIEVVGRGAFGTVYRARDTELQRTVAIKVPRSGELSNHEDEDRFVREARNVAQLRHAGIVPVYEVGRIDALPFIVSEFVEGLTLGDALTGPSLGFHVSAELVAHIAQALEHAHAQGIVHRDLKPSNIMLTSDGSPRVMDFGLAKRDAGEITMTIDGQVLGTPAYMSPEQASGQAHHVDGRSDIYSLGVILFQLLTGELPFRGNQRMLLHQVLHDEPRPPRTLNDRIPRDLQTICMKAMAKEPGRRYQTAQALADDLTHYLAGRPISARPVGRLERTWRLCRRHPRESALVGTIAVLIAVTAITGVAIRRHFADQSAVTHAAGLVQRVRDAEMAQVPLILSEMSAYRRWVNPLLREEHKKEEINSRQKLRITLALLPVDPRQKQYVYKYLLDAEPQEIVVLRDALATHKNELISRLWTVAEMPRKDSQRLRAASALAEYDPASTRWAGIQEPLANDLVSVPVIHLALWMDSLRPIREKIVVPLSTVYRDTTRPNVERSLATDILAEYAADQPELLADLLLDAEEKQFAILYSKLKAQSERVVPVLTREVDRRLPVDSKYDKKEKLAKRQANAAVALLKLNQPTKVWPLLKHSPDPTVRSFLIHRFGALGADAESILSHLDEESDLTIRRALVLSLGEFGEKQPSSKDRRVLLPKLQDIYRTAADPGLHASVEWLLRRWKQEAWLKQVNEAWATDGGQWDKCLEDIKQALTTNKEKTRPGTITPRWYVNGQAQTMVMVPGPAEFMMGSPLTDPRRHEYETQHKKRIDRTFAIAAKSVTVEQYRRFDQTYRLPEMYTRMADLPVVGTTWHEAAAYCNWLCKKEAIPEDKWCYEVKNGKVTRLKQQHLSLTGYRLPTEAEMEFATRAGAVTSWYYGETEDLLPKYAWYVRNSTDKTWPVGSLKPNDLGLFDAHGNVFTWCHDIYKVYPSSNEVQISDDKEDELVVDSTVPRAVRGGSFVLQPTNLRSAERNNNLPTSRSRDFGGFRLARTVRIGSLTTLTAIPAKD